MTTLKILSAGLVTFAMFATAASAQENSISERHAAERAHASVVPLSQGSTSHLWMLAPPAGANTMPTDQPGGICDHGDDPQIC